jgi:hypothetical protein
MRKSLCAALAAMAAVCLISGGANAASAHETTRKPAAHDAAPHTEASSDPFLGTWRLDVAKSNYAKGAAPRSSVIRTIALPGGELKTNVDTVLPGGTKGHAEFTYAYDGKDYPILSTARGAVDTIAYKRIDRRTVQITRKRGGRVLGITTLTVSASGRTATSVSSGRTKTGKPVKSIVVYDRE